MRRAAVAATLAAAACASAPPASRTRQDILDDRLTLVYDVDVAHAWEPGRSAGDLVSRSTEVIQRRIHGLFESGRVFADDNRLAVHLPKGTEEQYETFRRIARTPGRLRVAFVDDDSPYMQALARRVHDEPPAGVEIKEDHWRHPGSGAEHQDLFLAAERADDLATAVTELVLRDPLPPDREIWLDEGRHGSRTYFVVESGALDNTAIEGAEVRPGWDGRPEVQVVLTAEGRRRFTEMTARAVGRKIAIAIDGVVATAPMVLSPITNGRLHLMGDTGPDADPAAVKQALDDLAAVLRSGPLPAPIRLVRQRLYEHGRPILLHDVSLNDGRQGLPVASSRPLAASQSRRVPSW